MAQTGQKHCENEITGANDGQHLEAWDSFAVIPQMKGAVRFFCEIQWYLSKQLN